MLQTVLAAGRSASPLFLATYVHTFWSKNERSTAKTLQHRRSEHAMSVASPCPRMQSPYLQSKHCAYLLLPADIADFILGKQIKHRGSINCKMMLLAATGVLVESFLIGRHTRTKTFQGTRGTTPGRRPMACILLLSVYHFGQLLTIRHDTPTANKLAAVYL